MKNRNQKKNLFRALEFAKPHRWYVILILILTLLVAAAGVSEPLLMKYIFDRLGQQGVFTSVLLGVGGLLILTLLKETFTGFSNWLTWRIRLTIHYRLLSETVDRIHRLPFDYHRKQGVGAIMSKLEKAIQGFIGAISEFAFNMIPAIAYLTMALIIMLNLDWRMTILVLIFTPLPAFIAKKAAPHQSQREKFLMDKWSKIYSRFNEVLSGIVTVRSFAMEDYEKRRFLSNVGTANSVVVKGIRFDTSMQALQNITSMLARIAAITAGGYLVLQGEITLGTVIAFLGYIGGLFGPVQSLVNVYKTSQTAKASLDHIFNILDTQNSLGDIPNAVEAKDVKGKVNFKNVHFAYTDSRPILKGIDIDVVPGESVAMVGPSGSGKSTIMALLQRFYDPTKGNILLDDIEVSDYKQQSLRSQIGVVLQDALLFNESIRANIAYGRPQATKEEIEGAAKAANAHVFINELQEGYETVVGERGSRLSVGERQRIAIARALLKNPPILILDEATSALDAEVEALVQEALERLIKGRTTFIIAHRLSTVVNADKILVLKKGKIIESGTHRELMQKEGYYASLVEKQTKGLLLTK
ncbi:MAG: ABC transporter ATP-binding protein [Candidatus Cyclobacteriaceae bacterium M2_1C_046]